MPKIKTSELSGIALDWAVAKCEGKGEIEFNRLGGIDLINHEEMRIFVNYSPSSDWSQGGPIIEREEIDLAWSHEGCKGIIYGQGLFVQSGPTPLIAAMRAYVTSKLGHVVEVSEETIFRIAYRSGA